MPKQKTKLEALPPSRAAHRMPLLRAGRAAARVVRVAGASQSAAPTRATSSSPAAPPPLEACGTEARLSPAEGADGVWVLTLSRPAARNAIGRAMLADIERAVAALGAAAPASARALVLASAVPGVFCAGADLRERAGMTPAEALAFVGALRCAFRGVAALPLPTFAAVEGAALGGGLELALAADVRVAGADALFGLPEASLGIVPGAGGLARLPAAVGFPLALELVVTGRRLSAADAAAARLVSRAVPAGGALADALAAARAAAANAPVAVRAAKRALFDARAGGGGETAGYAAEAVAYDAIIGTADRLEGLAAFREKRRPVYHGR